MVQEKNKKFCPAVGKCGGCSMLATPYREQLARKQKTVEKLLQPYGKVEPILGMKQPEHYRHKFMLTISGEGSIMVTMRKRLIAWYG